MPNSSNGIIIGTPTTAAAYSFSVTATDIYSNTATEAVAGTVANAPVTGWNTTPPAGRNVATADNITFSNDNATATFDGASNEVVIGPTRTPDSGKYYFEISFSSYFDWARSVTDVAISVNASSNYNMMFRMFGDNWGDFSAAYCPFGGTQTLYNGGIGSKVTGGTFGFAIDEGNSMETIYLNGVGVMTCSHPGIGYGGTLSPAFRTDSSGATATLAVQAGAFQYPVPSGYSPWSP
jgi:hypothetical protein